VGWTTFSGRLTSRAVRAWRRPARAPAAGFTLLEIMVSLLLVTVGLMGTVAVQQTMFNATSNAGDAAVATRLAMRAMEELDAKTVSAGPPVVDQMAAAVTAGWSTPVYEDAQGNSREQQDAQFRFKREVQVTNLGPTFPYNISVRITYALDTGAPKTVRLDAQRWKTW
jgi:prepilin-type N-terminal cleavage/methylation domain-containing protein